MEWVTSIKITVMGQTTANYKSPCAEMSYDLCELGSEREGGSKTSLLNQWPVFEISKYRRTCQANLIRNAEQKWVQFSMKQTARSIFAGCLLWLLSLTHSKPSHWSWSFLSIVFSRFLSNVFEQAPPLATSHPWAKECPQVATFQPAARYPTPFCAPLPGFSLIFVLPHFISAFSQLPSLCPTGKRILTHWVGGKDKICWK